MHAINRTEDRSSTESTCCHILRDAYVGTGAQTLIFLHTLDIVESLARVHNPFQDLIAFIPFRQWSEDVLGHNNEVMIEHFVFFETRHMTFFKQLLVVN